MNDELLADLLRAVEQQLVAPQTRYVAATLDRLCGLGMNVEQAKEEIACCLGEEMDRVLRTRSGFDETSYRCALDALRKEEDQPE